MPFVLIGLILCATGAFFLRRSIREHDKEGKYGSIGLLIAGVILVLFFGIFYRTLVLFGS